MTQCYRYRITRFTFPFLTVLVAACSGLPIDLSENVKGKSSFAQPAPDEVLVGLAVSGGGSRAANFTAAVLEELAKVKTPSGGSLLEEIDYISSVSGGSLASTYYVVKKPDKSVEVLTKKSQLSPAYTAFFEQFRTDMRTNIDLRLLLTPKVWRWARVALTGYSRSRMLGDLWDDLFFDGATFAMLYDREQKGDVPRLLINATSRNDGKRFVFSTVGPKDLQFDLIRCCLDDSSRIPREIRRQQFVFLPWTFAKLHSDISQFRIAQAAAASASFPVALSSTLLRDFGPGNEQEERYYNITDGGVFDNQGIETVAQLFLHRLFDAPEGPQAKRALIIVVDASYPFERWYELDSGAASRLELPTSELERDFGIMERRALAYQNLLWAALTAEQKDERSRCLVEYPASQDDQRPDAKQAKEKGRCPVGRRQSRDDQRPDLKQGTDQKLCPTEGLCIVVLRHSCDGCWKEPIEAPPSCARESWVSNGQVDGSKLSEVLASIPTDFKISACHADLLSLSAKRAVDRKRETITKFLAR